jgi:hypothetical protein
MDQANKLAAELALRTEFESALHEALELAQTRSSVHIELRLEPRHQRLDPLEQAQHLHALAASQSQKATTARAQTLRHELDNGATQADCARRTGLTRGRINQLVG